MLTGIQHLHGALRWVVLVLLVLSIIKAFTGMSSRRSFADGDRKRGLFTMVALHVQLLLGFSLYFAKGPGELPRFMAMEHMGLMVLAVVLGTFGYSLAKRTELDHSKFRRQAIWFSAALVLILMAIPWPFGEFEAYGWW